MSGDVRRLHPSSILFGLLRTIKQFLFALLVTIFLASSGNQWALLGTAIALGFSGIKSVFDYITVRYQIRDGDLIVDEGLIFKRHRTVPVERIQNIDHLQNPIHRFFDVAEVRVETASGKEPEAVLRVLSMTDLQRLQENIFSQQSVRGDEKIVAVADKGIVGPKPVDPVQSPATQEGSEEGKPAEGKPIQAQPAQAQPTQVYEIPLSMLLKYGAVSFRGLTLIPVVFGFYWQWQWSGPESYRRFRGNLPDVSWLQTSWFVYIAAALCFVLFVVLGSAGWFAIRFYGYRMTRSGDDIRVSCGLLTRVSATIPRDKIQLVSVQSNLVARWLGLATIRIETAGGAGTENNKQAEGVLARMWFVPACRQSDVDRLLHEIRSDLSAGEDLPWQATSPRTRRRLLRLYVALAVLIGLIYGYLGGVGGYFATPVFIGMGVWTAIRYSRSLRYARGPDRVAYRSGLWIRRASMLFYDRVQSVVVTQGILDRRWNMARVKVDSAGSGPAKHRIEVAYLDADFAAHEAAAICASATGMLTGDLKQSSEIKRRDDAGAAPKMLPRPVARP